MPVGPERVPYQVFMLYCIIAVSSEFWSFPPIPKTPVLTHSVVNILERPKNVDQGRGTLPHALSFLSWRHPLRYMV